MDKIQKVLCRMGRWDLAQKYYLKVFAAEQLNVQQPQSLDVEFVTKLYYTRSPFVINIHFSRKPGISCFIYGCIKEAVEKFYSEVLPDLLRIKKIIESFNITVFIPSIDSVFVSQEQLLCTFYITAEEVIIDQIISSLKLEKSEEETK